MYKITLMIALFQEIEVIVIQIRRTNPLLLNISIKWRLMKNENVFFLEWMDFFLDDLRIDGQFELWP